MKIYLKKNLSRSYVRYLERMNSGIWVLMQEEEGEYDWEVRALDEFECNFVESVFQHFAEPMKKLTGE